VPRGLPGLAVSVAVGAVVVLARGGADAGPAGLTRPVAALLLGAALGVVAALGGLAASYVSVESPAETAGPARGWALPVVQAVLPLAACAPVALALSTVL
jgi:hypothetical protein